MHTNEYSELFKIREKLAKIKSEKKPYNLAFYGIGNVAKDALTILSSTSSLDFDSPLDKIYLIGGERSGSMERRKRLGEQIDEAFIQNGQSQTKTIIKKQEELPEIIDDIDLLLFTASGSPNYETDRKKMTISNKYVVKQFAEYFNKGINNNNQFNGIINFVSNLPEALAHHAARELKLKDSRQITAHIPIDVMRYEKLVNSIINPESGTKLDLTVVGYHDKPWPVINGSQVVIGKKYDGSPICESIDNLIREKIDANSLAKTLENYALRQAELFKREVAGKSKQYKNEIISTESPTSIPAGRAIVEFIKAVVNKDKTTCSIPYKINGKSFFVYLPVTFEKGLPQLDKEKFSRLTEEDRYQLKQRIIGTEYNSRTLERTIKDTIGERFSDNKYRENLAEIMEPIKRIPSEYRDIGLGETSHIAEEILVSRWLTELSNTQPSDTSGERFTLEDDNLNKDIYLDIPEIGYRQKIKRSQLDLVKKHKSAIQYLKY